MFGTGLKFFSSSESSTPARTFVVGDVHGYIKPLSALFATLAPTRRDTVVMLGDYIDRGPDSKKVLQFLKKQAKSCNLITLRGNHEDILFHILEDPLYALANTEDWLTWGGAETLQSFNVKFPYQLPGWVFTFLKSCPLYYETDKNLFVHANFDPQLPLNVQDPDILCWQRVYSTFDYPRHCSGKMGFVGHTAQKSGQILEKEGFWCLDTYLYGGRYLTAAEVETGRTWRATQDGTVKESFKLHNYSDNS